MEEKKFALRMLASDPKTMLDDHLVLAAIVPKKGRKVLYVCPEEQHPVRVEVALVYYSAAWQLTQMPDAFGQSLTGKL